MRYSPAQMMPRASAAPSRAHKPTSWWLGKLRHRATKQSDETLDLSCSVTFASEAERDAAIRFFNAAYRAEESGIRQAHALAEQMRTIDPDLAEALELYGYEEGWHRDLLTTFLEHIGGEVRPMGTVTGAFYALYARAERMETIMLANLMFETIGSTTYRLALRHAEQPAVRHMLAILTRDEAFHVPLNVHFLREVLRRKPDVSRARLRFLYQLLFVALVASTIASRRRAQKFDHIPLATLARAYAEHLAGLFEHETESRAACAALVASLGRHRRCRAQACGRARRDQRGGGRGVGRPRQGRRQRVVSMPELVVEARDLRKRYGEGAGVRAALDGVSLDVERGEFVAVLGPSGCGKSTLLGIIGGLDRGYEGELTLFGRDTRKLADGALAEMRGSRIGFVFQAFHLLGHLSTRDNVLAPTLFVRESVDAGRAEKFEARAASLLDEVGLGGRGDDMPATMSGGERQRIAIARALLMDPPLLLCDEPTGNLDVATGSQIVEIFRLLHRERDLTIVAVTHEQQLADAADRVVHLRGGKIVAAEEKA